MRDLQRGYAMNPTPDLPHGNAPSRRALVIGLAGLSCALMAQAPRPIRLVAFGDSLTAGFGLAQSAAYPVQLQRVLRERGRAVEIENAGVSGDTAAAGLARLDWSVPDGTDGVLLALGANDGLRGLDPAAMERTLDAIVQRLRARNIPVLLMGMLAPRNLGQDYAGRFDPVFPRLAERYGLVLLPFLLDGVAGDPALNIADGIHPNPRGIAVMIERMLPTVERFLGTLGR
jgi:acyl-CoA thioesterase I